jgi:HAD superfamily hydrolase (TIGR01509 family)
MTTAPTTIRCILFDLGHTLWAPGDPAVMRREEMDAEARTGATLRALLSPDEVTWDDAGCGHDLRQHFFRQLYAAHDAEPLLEPDFAALIRDILHSMSITRADTQWGALLYEAMRTRWAHTHVLYPDVLSTLDILQQRGYALGVVTNRAYGGPPFLDDLDQLGLLRFFDPQHIAISADLGYRKPHPDIFLHALAGLDRAPRETAMVGDRMGADIIGAHQLRMFSIWRPQVTETELPVQIEPDAVITQIADLQMLFP